MQPRVFRQVPTVAQVVPGAYVHIVLKQDQPTGRTVHGVVQNVLTRGNHPRGIKVRLSDGRVGRVQTMGSPSGTDSPVVSPIASAASASSAFAPTTSTTLDEDDAPREQIGLDAYIRTRPKQQKRRGHGSLGPVSAGAAVAAVPPATTATTKCPVCDDFEGDEAAVSHHVSSHFDG